MRFVLFALLLAAPALAEGNASDKPALACLKTAEDSGGDASRCAGLIMSACEKSGGGDTDCATKELAFWQARLDAAWRQAKPLLAGYPELAPDQTEAQSLWLRYRDKSCAIADKVDPGTMPGGSAACRMRETAARAIAVMSIVDSLSEH